MGDHYVDVVDREDKVIGSDLKSNKIAKGFISRVVAILLCDTSGKFLVCRRAPKKRNAAGLYDLAAFGNVMKGESYVAAAARELKEELNISCSLRLLDRFYQEVHNDGCTFKIFCGVFLGVTGESPELNEELVEVKRMGFGEVESALASRPGDFCPGFVNDFNQVKEKLRDYRI